MDKLGNIMSCPFDTNQNMHWILNDLKGGYPADFVYTSESNESCEKHSTQR